ncbi:Hypothetical protein D9617_17g046560 [Elsinoe fawcettii]|nr:Hypothetical protein D9617_17g046560 [Elsinoe fawcettii]
MAHIILTGATGQAGAAVLKLAMSHPSISKITLLSRRPVALASSSPKVTTILHQDFTSYPSSLLDQLKGAQGCVWALGISAVGMQEGPYTEITYGYPLAAARAFAGLASSTAKEAENTDGGKGSSGGGEGKFKFIYVSGEGARQDGKGQLFARVKGRTEKDLMALQNELSGLSVYNIRPGAIVPSRDLGHLAERKKNWVDVGLGAFGWAFDAVGMAIGTETLGNACLRLVLGDGEEVKGEGVEEGRLVRNKGLRRIGGASA